MIRKIVLQLLVSMVIIFTLTSAFVFIIIHINKGKPEKQDKLYEINTIHDGLIQTIAYYLVKPIFESALDHYIKKHGLAEYLEEITQQKREKNMTSFYEIKEGNGSKALCGQEILLQVYKIPNNLTMPLLNQVFNVSFRIGQNNWKELGLGIIGMKEGGERVVTVNSITNDNQMNFSSYYVKLLKVKDRYPDPVNNMMIFDDLINKTGKQVKCGDKISIKYSIMRHDGEYIIKNQTIQFKVGDKKVPLAIELGAIGMRTNNKRTIISPPELLNVTDSMSVEDIGFDEEHVSIINLSLDANLQ
ncbi:FKBP-type peptidyl-prolyl cis-trans isomerase [Wolbachia endosymbiont of Dirofilaria (Dirofilaria) immitis]|uniref:FKBP-type peptidyl-prolyl cis-trans isomerase n=1 Tax=Wolbachia endosymbiont of Dirofilaria (Dirofilaria) immitis TaxID=1812115 RepID=UPI001589A1D7|nr:FKBP-type peptidyl-prolyl cis-trans isomerase [Wolbachia endosymbiont of Dirofilaria (Dirofilaria) immitis]QKX02021.1 peptidylprolyl isomerase [Wolbachia endosymbiont of Dirofilaria (Dirofilaria) immitis]